MEICCSGETLLAFDEWIHTHSGEIRITRIALEILGALTVACTCIAFEAVYIPLLAAGFGLIVITEITYQILSFSGILTNDPTNHVFTESTYGKSRIYYQDDLPILELGQEDPFQSGFEQGYLLAPHIFKLLWRTRLSAKFFGFFHFDEMEARLPEIKKAIPEKYLKELEGLVAGMNAWDKETSIFWESPMTLDEMLLFQLIPDMAHFTLSHLPVMGCTVLVDGNPNIVGRNLDWPSLNVYGENSIIRHNLHEKTYSFTIPGLTGDLTVINDAGLFFAFNVCSPKVRIDELEGDKIPSVFLVRDLATTYANIDDIPHDLSPLAPFHLNVVGPTKAAAFHFRQGRFEETLVRELNGERLATFNDYHESPTKKTHKLFFSDQRAAAANTEKSIDQTLKESPINNHLTIHRIVYNTETREVSVAFANSFAGTQPPTTFVLPH